MTDHDHIGELLKLAGHRHMPDAAEMAGARAVAHAEWTRAVARRRGRMFLQVFAAAAAAVVAVLMSSGSWFESETDRVAVPAAPMAIARLETIVGSVFVTSQGSGQRNVTAVGASLVAGDRLVTSNGSRVVLALRDGVAVKLDEGSSVALDSVNTIVLNGGAVFVDADPAYRNAAVDVRTPLGVVRHIGTQFEVRFHDEELRVRVRDGVISLESAGKQWTSHAGEALVVARGSAPVRQTIATSGREWGWVNQLAPPFMLEGATLGAFLTWIERYYGIQLEFSEPSRRAAVEEIVLHGSIDGLSAEEALAAVLPASGLTFRRQGDLLIIRGP